MTLIDEFEVEKECIFEDERYLVRNNGAVFRFPKIGRKARKNDNEWTFGKETPSHPYLHISGTRAHRIVATAFHGDPTEDNMVVDHIDTNCKNNRPENLRWLTRLENALKNPITIKKIIYRCGSVDSFLDNPSQLNEGDLGPQYEWMRTVSKEEAENCKKRMKIFVNTESKTSRGPVNERARKAFERNIYQPINKFDVGFGREPGLDISKTSLCATYTLEANYFPLCPDNFEAVPLEEYYNNLVVGEVFAYTDSYEDHPGFSYSLKVVKASNQMDKQTIIVLCQQDENKYRIVGIELYKKNNWFVHHNLGTYLSPFEADKAFYEKQQLNIDDFYKESYRNFGK